MSDETQGTASLPAEGSAAPADAATHQVEQAAQQEGVSGQQEQAEQAGERTEGEQTERKRLSGAQKAKRRETYLLNQLAERDRELEAYRQAGRRDDGERADAKPPKEDDFNGDWGAYIAARAAYEATNAIDKRLSAREETDRSARQQAVQREIVADHLDRCEEARLVIKDFDQVVQAAAHLNVREEVGRLILSSDKSALLQYHLAQNPETLHRLNGIGGNELARQIGRLEASLTTPQRKQTTTAPPPMTRLTGGAGPAVDLGKADMDAYVAERKRQGFAGRG